MMENKPNYYLIAVSNKKNLELCIKYGIAGFMNSISGAWTFLDVNEGDFISFIYGARAFNLYKVSKKIAISNAEGLPPWENIKFRETGYTYYFPFRFELELIREFSEPIVRYEFTYVAENLLLRGGYRKTHFQADQTTLQNVSSMGKKSNSMTEKIDYPQIEKFTPHITFIDTNIKIPFVYKFKELFLQSIIKHNLSIKSNLVKLLDDLGYINLKEINFEVLSEKALPQGHVDLLLKEAIPLGTSKQVVIEVKTNKASIKDFEQLKSYMNEIGTDCVGGILIAKDFQKKINKIDNQIGLVKYQFSKTDKEIFSIEELMNNLILTKI
jgi:hypothetical protein